MQAARFPVAYGPLPRERGISNDPNLHADETIFLLFKNIIKIQITNIN